MSWPPYSPYNSPPASPPTPPSPTIDYIDNHQPFNPAPLPPEFEQLPPTHSSTHHEHHYHEHHEHHEQEDDGFDDDFEDDGFDHQDCIEFCRHHRHENGHRHHHRHGHSHSHSRSRSRRYTDVSEIQHLPELEMPSLRTRPVSYPARPEAQPSVSALNHLPAHTAYELMYACLPDAGYAQAMVAGRPFPDVDALIALSRKTWNNMQDQWREAFRKHDPVARISSGDGVLGNWIRREAAEMRPGFEGALKREIREMEGKYKRKHGFSFVTALEGKDANDILEELRGRLEHETDIEVFEASAEQVSITASRLHRALVEARAM